jgi:DNA-binding NtrC family response regulator
LSHSVFRVLVVDDEARHADLLARELRDRGYEAVATNSGDDALRRASQERFDAVVTDLRMRPPDGLEVLRQLRQDRPETAVILMTAYADTRAAVQAIHNGAYDFLTKDPDADPEEVALRLDRLRESRAGTREREQLMSQVSALRHGAVPIIGSGGALRAALDLLDKVAITDSTVLLSGETGTGKDLFARAVHYCSPRAAGPWVKVNCGALPESLLESELFGHERGAFTGAVARKLGRFEQADRGTLFLDEIGELTLALQVKLLQILEEKSFVRVGGQETLSVDVRIVAATNRDLRDEVSSGNFREDLFYRLNIFPIYLPPLRQRREDIPALVNYFLTKAGAPTDKITAEARAALEAYDYPGNVREMEHILERALITGAGESPGQQEPGGAAAGPHPAHPVLEDGEARLAVSGRAGGRGDRGRGRGGPGLGGGCKLLLGAEDEFG